MRDTNFGTNCVCRVPKKKLEEVRLAILGDGTVCCVCVWGGGDTACMHVGMYVQRRQKRAEPHAHIDTMALFSSGSGGKPAKVHNAASYTVFILQCS